MTTPQTPPADAVARLTKLADDYASRGDFATEDDIRTLLAAYADAARDRERVEWLEAQAKPHHGVILCAQVVSGETPWASVQRVDHRHNPHKVEWCHESHDLRAAIDAARTGEAR